MPIRIIPVDYGNRGLGYNIQINDDEVSVQEYLDQLNDALLALELSRSREKTGVCRGCDGCCGERIPLTSIDLEVLSQNPYVQGKVSQGIGSSVEKLGEIIRRFCHVYVSGRSVDITLRLDPEGKCIFLNKAAKTCSIYEHRPFVCQTFICCPASREALELRESLVNSGEDELVRRWINQAREFSQELLYDEADAPDIDFEDWKQGPFTGKGNYREILLKDVLPVSLWNRLRKGIA